MIKDNSTSKYLLYAIGEVILVVIGILIALQINNTNEANKTRAKELHYLKNIKKDLSVNTANIDVYLETRSKAINAASEVLAHYEGKPITDYEDFNAKTINVYTWQKFFQSNNTFKELVNSGNLALVSNDSIKTYLLNIESLYDVLKAEEAHFRYDAEKLLYDPYFQLVDSNPLVQNFTYKVTEGKAGIRVPLGEQHFQKLLNDISHKNGFVMAVYELTVMNGQLQAMKTMSQELMILIDSELNKDK